MIHSCFVITTDSEGKIINNTVHSDDASMEEEFTRKCVCYGVMPDEDNFIEHAMHLEDGTSIYMAMVPTQL